jgi:hypothetical protein
MHVYAGPDPVLTVTKPRGKKEYIVAPGQFANTFTSFPGDGPWKFCAKLTPESFDRTKPIYTTIHLESKYTCSNIFA